MLLNSIILISFLIEVVILYFIEHKIWGTIYTPLNFLMLPYCAVLFLTLLLAGHLDFKLLYYPSILVWSFGLFFFFIPSALLAYCVNRKKLLLRKNRSILKQSSTSFLSGISFVVAILFLFRIFVVIRNLGTDQIGTDDFGFAFCGYGFWAHLNVTASILLIALIYNFEKFKFLYSIYILCFLIVAFLYGVKGWIIIPLTAGLSLRIYNDRLSLNFSLIVKVLIIALLIFLLSYSLSLVLSGDSSFDDELLIFICKHFLFYFTSGILGLSECMKLGLDSYDNLFVLFTPIENVVNYLLSEPLKSPLNDVFLSSGYDYTNVRTFFGIIYINTDVVEFAFVSFLVGFVFYAHYIVTLLSNSQLLHISYVYLCGMLAMGWFDFYFSSLMAYEVPLLLLFCFCSIQLKKKIIL